MTEEFVRRVADWVELPAGPVPADGAATGEGSLRASSLLTVEVRAEVRKEQ